LKDIIEFFQSFNFPNLVHLNLDLYLADNEQDFPILKIEGKWFSRLPQLEVLEILQGNSDSIIDPDLFKNVPRLKKLTLHFNIIVDVESLFVALSHLNDLKTLYLSANWLHNLSLNFLPPNLDKLRLTHTRNNIGTFKGDLSHVKNLRWLNIFGFNYFKLFKPSILPGDSISCAKNLNYSSGLVDLDLRFNSITELDESYFINLRQLSHLNLTANQLEKISAKVFKGLESLKTLDLSHNKITEIDENAFSDLSGLQELQLSRNRLVRIKSDTFGGLPNLRQLILNYNSIEQIDSKAFKELLQLIFLTIESNKLQMITRDMFEGLTNLKELRLSNNKIEYIGANFMENLFNVEILKLSFNKIIKIDSEMFATASNLEDLNLSNNQIREIEPNSFKALGNLKQLYLECNPLSQIHRSCFESLKAICIVDIGKKY